MSDKEINNYSLKKIFVFNDLFNDDFDLDWQIVEKVKTCTILPQERKHIKSVPAPEVFDDGKVIYNFNDDFFRSDNFTKTHDGEHILFSGCSETEGAGGNIEDTWSKILYNKISKEKRCSGFFNLARSGWGYQRIISNCLVYFKKYGYPNTLFVMLPNSGRNFYYQEKDKTKPSWGYKVSVPKLFLENKKYNKAFTETQKNNIEITVSHQQYLENFVNFLYAWKLFVNFCKEKNIRLIFSTWDLIDHENLISLNIFDEYIEIRSSDISHFGKKYFENKDPLPEDYRKRDGHHGVMVHHCWAECFYQAYINEQRNS